MTDAWAVYHYRNADPSELLVIARPDYRLQVRKYDPLLFPTLDAAHRYCYTTATAANSAGRRVSIVQEQDNEEGPA